MKINLGCGEFKLEGFTNVDMVKEVNPDVCFDFRREEFPFEKDSVDEIFMSHCLEHIEYRYWYHVFIQMWDVLKLGGRAVLIYPEFATCAKNFIENKRGLRDFWRVALYGRQSYPGDYHVVPVVTQSLIQILMHMGFTDFKHGPEQDNDDYATCLTFVKTERLSRSEAFYKAFMKEL